MLTAIRETKNLNRSFEIRAKSGLFRSLNYHPALHTLQNSFQVLILFSLIKPFRLAIGSSVTDDRFFTYVCMSGLLVGSLILIFYIKRLLVPFMGDHRTVHVFANHIEVESASMDQPVSLRFSSMTAVSLRWIPFLGAWISIELKNGDRIKFSAALERSEYILKAISMFKKSLVNESQLKNFKITAVFVDHMLSRTEQRASNRTMSCLKYFILPSFLFLLSHGSAFESVLWDMTALTSQYILPGLVIGMILSLLQEYLYYAPITSKKVSKGLLGRDIPKEIFMEQIVGIAHILILSGYLYLN